MQLNKFLCCCVAAWIKFSVQLNKVFARTVQSFSGIESRFLVESNHIFSRIKHNNYQVVSGSPTPAEEDRVPVPESMDPDCIVQCWFRFLHVLGNPADLTHPNLISNTPKFLHHALTSDIVMDPDQHECLRALPVIFYRAMHSISILVDAFLGNDGSCERFR